MMLNHFIKYVNLTMIVVFILKAHINNKNN